MSSYVVVVRLASSSWYVECTDGDPEALYTRLFNGDGPEWTTIHKVQSMEYVGMGGPDDAVVMTINLMKRYSIDKVRGGPWTDVSLEPIVKFDLQLRMESMNTTPCWICGVSGHLPTLCSTPRCTRCYRWGHFGECCGGCRDRFSSPINPYIHCSICHRHSHSGTLVCSWEQAEIRDLVDDILSCQIDGVTGVRSVDGVTEYCTETSGGNFWLRYSKLCDIRDELETRDIHVDGFPCKTICGWLFGNTQSTIEWRRQCLDAYFRKLPTRRVV